MAAVVRGVDLERLKSLKVGDYITLEEESHKYQIQARGERYLVCTKPFNARRTVLYTIVDLVEGVRGTENLVFGGGFESRADCEEAMDRLEGAGTRFGHTEVSHRNRVPVRAKTIWIS